jgi:asparagine synthetase B (glutamine-hydrolysing)
LLSGHPAQFLTCCRAYIYADGWARFFKDYVRFMSRTVYDRQAQRWQADKLLSPAAARAVPPQLHHINLGTQNLSREIQFSHSNGLTNLLQYGDAVSMAVSLETRCPFMDYRLVEFGFSLEPHALVNHGFGKHILRECAQNDLPREICWRRKKDGFTNATTRVLRELVLRDGLPRAGVEYALDTGLFRKGLTDPHVVRQLPENILFRVVSVLLWAEQFYGAKAGARTLSAVAS